MRRRAKGAGRAAELPRQCERRILSWMQTLLDAWKKRCFRKSALWIYGKRDRCIDQLCKRITGGVRGTLVAFGGAASCSTCFGFHPSNFCTMGASLESLNSLPTCVFLVAKPVSKYRTTLAGKCLSGNRDISTVHFGQTGSKTLLWRWSAEIYIGITTETPPP